MTFWLIFGSAFVLTYVLVPLVRRLAARWGAVDFPGVRKIHRQPTPSLGGLAFYLVLLATAAGVTWLFPGLHIEHTRILLLGGLVILLIGFCDDLYDLPASLKLPAEIGVALLLYHAGFRVVRVSNPFGGAVELGWSSLLFTVVWLVGVINAINMVDGLDGLAAGVAFIAAMTLAATEFRDSGTYCFLLPMLMGISAAFLRFNFYPASIFMGDTGSLLLGYLLAVAALLGHTKGKGALALLVPLIALGVAVFDILTSVVRRLAGGQHPFRADRQHLHHRLLDLGLGQRQVVLMLYVVCMWLSILAYVFSELPPHYTLLLFLILGLGLFLGFLLLRYMEQKVEEKLQINNRQEDPHH